MAPGYTSPIQTPQNLNDKNHSKPTTSEHSRLARNDYLMLHPTNGKKSSIFGLQLGKEAHSPCFFGLKPSTRYEINSNFVSSNSLSRPPFFLGATTPFHFGSSHLPHLEQAICWVSSFLGWQIAKPKKNAMSSKAKLDFLGFKILQDSFLAKAFKT